MPALGRFFGKAWLLRILALMALLDGMLVACVVPTTQVPKAPTTTQPKPVIEITETPESPTVGPAQCLFERESVDDYWIWYQPDPCSRGVAVAISSTVPVSQVEELPFDSPKGDEANFQFLDQ